MGQIVRRSGPNRASLMSVNTPCPVGKYTTGVCSGWAMVDENILAFCPPHTDLLGGVKETLLDRDTLPNQEIQQYELQ